MGRNGSMNPNAAALRLAPAGHQSEGPRSLDAFVGSILESLPDMVFVKDAEELKFVRLNKAGEDLLGYSRDELLGKNDHSLFPKPQADFFAAKDREVLEGGKLVEIAEEAIETREHETRFLHTKKIPILDGEGRPRFLLGISEDITDRKRADDELRRESARLQLLLAIAVAANEASSPDDAMQIAIDAVCAHTGWPVGHAYVVADDGTAELEPTSIWHLDDPAHYRPFRRRTEVIRYGAGAGLPGRVAASGQPAWISDLAKDPNFPRAEAAGEVGLEAGFAFPVLIGREVVAVLEFFSSKCAEPDVRLLEVMGNVGTQLGRVVERKRTELLQRSFSAIVSHDLKNPLFGILLRLTSMKNHPGLPPDQARSVGAMLSSAKRMERIIRDLLDYTSHRDGSGIPIAPVPADFDAICFEIITELETCYGDCRIVYRTSGEGHGLWDPARMSQIIQNLLANALEQSPRKIPVSLRWEAFGDELFIEVHHSGDPIPSDMLPHVFRPFRRGRRSDTSGNIGIGLFIVEQIVQALGGTVTVRSSESEGTTFTVRVPRVRDTFDS